MSLVQSNRATRVSSRAKPASTSWRNTPPFSLNPAANRKDHQTPMKRGATSANSDLQISFPGSGRIEFLSTALFSDPHSALAREFFERAFLAPEVDQVEIDAGRRKAEISFRTDAASTRALLKKISRFLSHGKPSSDTSKPLIFPSNLFESKEKLVRLCRHGQRLSSSAIKHEIEGRIRLRNPALSRKRELCQAIERELMNAFGVDRYFTNELTSSLIIYYDQRQIQKHQLIEILDDVLHKSKDIGPTPVDLDLPICAASVGLAATSRLVPALTPLRA
jgi:Heavy metal associated domain 2